MTRQELELLVKMRTDADATMNNLASAIRKLTDNVSTGDNATTKFNATLDQSGASATAAGVAIGTFAVKAVERMKDLAVETVTTAARTQGLVAVAEYLGQKSGKTKDQIDDLITTVKHQGVTTQESANLVIQLSRANLGLENATKLATVAQNAAFVAGKSTAESTGLLMQGIMTLQPELIRSAGITVSLEQAEREYAKANHVATDSLTTHQKQQLLLQAVLKEGDKINGVYALSMQYVGKQLTSLPRYIEEAKNAVGTELLPILGASVTGFTELLKVITAHPAVFANLAMATAAVVGPLVLAKGAAFAGIPTFLDLAGSVKTAGGALTVFQGLSSFGDVRAGIQLLGEQAGITFAKLGLLGSGAAIVAAGFAGWELGRWIAGLTGMDDKIATLADGMLGLGLSSATAGAQQDAITIAIARGAAATVDYTRAVQFNAEWLDRHRLQVSGNEIALKELIATQERFHVTVSETSYVLQQQADGTFVEVSKGAEDMTMSVGHADDSVRRLLASFKELEAHPPKIDWKALQPPKGLTLDPGKDATEMLKSLDAGDRILNLLGQRSHDVADALMKIGSSLSVVKEGLAEGTLKAKDLEETYGITANAAAVLEKEFKKQAEASKKAGEETKKWEAIVQEVEGSGDNYAATLDTIAGATLDASRAAIQAGKDHASLAAYYGLTKTQLAALVKEHGEYQHMIDLTRKLEIDGLEKGLKQYEQWAAGVSKAADEVGKDIIAGALAITTAQKAIAELVGAETLSAYDQQIAKIEQWAESAKGSFKGTADQAKVYFDLIDEEAGRKINAIGSDWETLRKESKASLQDTADHAAATYDYMVAHADEFSAATIQRFKQTAIEAQRAADGIEHGFTDALGRLSDVFVKLGQVAGGSFGNILQAVGQTVVQLHAAQVEADKSGGKFGYLSTVFDSNAKGSDRLAAGVMAVGNVAQGVSDVMAATASHASAAGNAMGGAMAGMKAGAFAGPWGMAVGAAAGFMVGLIRGKPEWAKAAEQISNDFGTKISNNLAKTIAQGAKDFAGSSQASAIGHLSDILKEAGGLSESNLPQMTARLHDVFSMIETHQFTIEQGTKVLDENWQAFADAGTDASGRLSDSLRDLINLNDEFGTKSKAMMAYTINQASLEADGFNAVAAGMLEVNGNLKIMDDLKKAVDDARESGKGLTEALDAQHTAAVIASGGLQDLGVQAVAAFAVAVASGKSEADALKAIHPALAGMRQAYADLGIEVDDAALKQLMLRDAIATAAPQLTAAVAGLSQEMIALDNLGGMNVKTFEAMERTGQSLFDRLTAKVKEFGGTDEDALAQMQSFLHQAVIEAKRLGVPLDENTQHMIDMSRAAGIWDDTATGGTESVTGAVMKLVDKMSRLIDLLGGATDGADNFGGAGKAGADKTAAGLAVVIDRADRTRKAFELAGDAAAKFGDDGYAASKGVSYGHSPGGLDDMERHLKLVSTLFTNVGATAKAALGVVLDKQKDATDALDDYTKRWQVVRDIAGFANNIGASLSSALGKLTSKSDTQNALADLAKREAQVREQIEDRLQREALDALNVKKAAIESTDAVALAGIQAQIDAQQQLIDQTKRARDLRDEQAALDEIAAARKTVNGQASTTGAAGLSNRSAFDSALHLAVAAFAQETKISGDAISAMDDVQGAFEAIDEAQKTFGYSTTAGMQKVIDLYRVIRDNRAVVTAISADNQALMALHETGMLDHDTLQMFAQDATANFKTLTAAGVNVNQALGLVAPTLQILGAHQKELGTVTDETTLKMWEMANQYGLVGKDMISTNSAILQSILDLTKAIANVPGGVGGGGKPGPGTTVVEGLLDPNMRGSADEAIAYIQKVIKRTLTSGEIAEATALVHYTGGDVTGAMVNQILTALAQRARPMKMGGSGRVDGPSLFYSAGDEDYAFSGEGRKFRGGSSSSSSSAAAGVGVGDIYIAIDQKSGQARRMSKDEYRQIESGMATGQIRVPRQAIVGRL